MKDELVARNARIFEAVIRGNTLVTAAEGLSIERVRQIVNQMRRMMMHPTRLGTAVAPERCYGLLQRMGGAGIKDMRTDADFWLVQLAKWKAEHGSNV